MPFCEDASPGMKYANPALTYYHTHRHATIDVIMMMIIVMTGIVIIVMTTMLIIWMSTMAIIVRAAMMIMGMIMATMLVMMMMPRW